MAKTIIISSQNENKLKEFEYFFNDYYILTPRDFIEDFSVIEDGNSYTQNAIKKCTELYNTILKRYGVVKYPILGDDSGLEIDDLDGAPGILSNRYWTPDKSEGDSDFNNKEMIKALLKTNKPQPWYATYVAVINVIFPNEFSISSTQTCEGIIIPEPRGTNGFAYDPYFELIKTKKTIAELTIDEKRNITHRAKAAKEIKQIIDSFYCKKK